MEDVRQWLESYKNQLILAGALAMVLAPFLWPFFLAVLFQVFCIAIPVVAAGTMIQMFKEEKYMDRKELRKDSTQRILRFQQERRFPVQGHQAVRKFHRQILYRNRTEKREISR